MRIHAIEKVVENTPLHKTFYFSDSECEKAQPGQFVMVWVPGVGEVPMSLSSIQGKQAVTVEAKGNVTKKMHGMKAGDKIGIRGPYGKGFSVNGGKLLFIAGGTGIAPLFPLIEMADGDKTVILGARSSSLLLFENEIDNMDVELHISTDDGSMGHKGFVTDIFEGMEGREFDTVYTCGPEIMMKKVLDICMKKSIPMQASLERYMKCGMGICGSCDINGYRVCKDGPVFGSTTLSKMDDFGKWKRDETGRKVRI
ncbi:MAG: dihydroorotate dehydrogenase electron transfer subunit [Nitrospiraceae bacterium]|nr:dihydroorotate dehydrogenase electron transfer subunit [Nitrospiraceae bacterium]